jgi:glutamine synthetase
MPHPTAPELQAYFQQHGVHEVECVFPDISGYPRAVVIHDCVELDGTPCLCERRPPAARRVENRIAGADASPVARQLLGDTFVTGFCAVKALEHDSYLNEISAWERRYLLPLV